MSPCPEATRIHTFLASAIEFETITEHLQTCASCQRLLEEDTRTPTPGGPPLMQFLAPGMMQTPSDAELPPVPGYELLKKLGEGGMGVVYQARHLRLDRVVALKMLREGVLGGPESLRRFRTEAEAVAKLQHPNVIQVYEFGEYRDRPFLAMEHCPAGSLKAKQRGKPLPPRPAAALVEALARGVQAVHAEGIVHRDLKPANVLLAADGTPRIADFGLAKKVDEPGRTLAGSPMGTPEYMAPEQARGDIAAVGPAADVYALGATLYELLTGRPPFEAPTAAETLLLVLSADPVPPRRLSPGLPADLETICLKCLHKEPAQRYAGAAELAEDLRRFQAGEPIAARPAGVPERLWRWCRRKPALAAAGAAALVILLAWLGTATAGYVVIQATAAEEYQQRIKAEANERHAVAATAAKEKALQEVTWRLRQLDKSNEILGLVVQDLDFKVHHLDGKPWHVQMSERFDQAAAKLGEVEIGNPLTIARLQYRLGASQDSLGYPGKGITLLDKARRTFQTELGKDDPETQVALSRLAWANQAVGDRAAALSCFEQLLEHYLASPRPSPPDILVLTNQVAPAYLKQGQVDRAVRLLERTQAMTRREKYLADSWLGHVNTSVFGEALTRQGSYAAAHPLLLAGYEGMKKQENEETEEINHWRLCEGAGRLVRLYDAWGKREEAAKWRVEMEIHEQWLRNHLFRPPEREREPLSSAVSAIIPPPMLDTPVFPRFEGALPRLPRIKQ